MQLVVRELQELQAPRLLQRAVEISDLVVLEEEGLQTVEVPELGRQMRQPVVHGVKHLEIVAGGRQLAVERRELVRINEQPLELIQISAKQATMTRMREDARRG